MTRLSKHIQCGVWHLNQGGNKTLRAANLLTILEVPVFPISHIITFFLTKSLVAVQLPLKQEQQGTNSLQLFLSSASNGPKAFSKIPECVVSRCFRMKMLQLNFKIEATIFNSSPAFLNFPKYYMISIMQKEKTPQWDNTVWQNQSNFTLTSFIFLSWF